MLAGSAGRRVAGVVPRLNRGVAGAGVVDANTPWAIRSSETGRRLTQNFSDAVSHDLVRLAACSQCSHLKPLAWHARSWSTGL